MTSTGPTEAEKLAQAQKIQNLALTHQQIAAACCMWRDPQNWWLVPTGVGKRCLYVRDVKKAKQQNAPLHS